MKLHKGFTLVELVAVLVLVGILAAVALPRLPSVGGLEPSLQVHPVLGLLRLAQLRAMNDPLALQAGGDVTRCGVVAVTAAGISLSADCAGATLLDEETLVAAADQGLFYGAELAVGASVVLPLTLQFGELAVNTDYLSDTSRLGQPFVNGERLTDPLTLFIGDRRLLIEPEGYLHAVP